MSEIEMLLISQARKSNPDLHRRTDGEILQMFKENSMPNGEDQIIEETLTEDAPQYRIRDQLRRDFSPDGIPKDFIKGLGQTKDSFLEDISGLTEGIGSIKNKYFDPAVDKVQGYGKKGIDWGKMAVRGMGNMIMPGLGFILGGMKEDPRNKYLADPYTMQNYTGKNYGYVNQLRHGNLPGQDQFGINTISALGDYQNYYNNYMNDYNKGNKKGKFADDKYAFAQDVTGTGNSSSNITGTPLITSNNTNQNNVGGGRSTDYAGAQGTTAFDSKSGKGRRGYSNGGIASLWQK